MDNPIKQYLETNNMAKDSRQLTYISNAKEEFNNLSKAIFDQLYAMPVRDRYSKSSKYEDIISFCHSLTQEEDRQSSIVDKAQAIVDQVTKKIKKDIPAAIQHELNQLKTAFLTELQENAGIEKMFTATVMTKLTNTIKLVFNNTQEQESVTIKDFLSKVQLHIKLPTKLLQQLLPHALDYNSKDCGINTLAQIINTKALEYFTQEIQINKKTSATWGYFSDTKFNDANVEKFADDVNNVMKSMLIILPVIQKLNKNFEQKQIDKVVKKLQLIFSSFNYEYLESHQNELIEQLNNQLKQCLSLRNNAFKSKSLSKLGKNILKDYKVWLDNRDESGDDTAYESGSESEDTTDSESMSDSDTSTNSIIDSTGLADTQSNSSPEEMTTCMLPFQENREEQIIVEKITVTIEWEEDVPLCCKIEQPVKISKPETLATEHSLSDICYETVELPHNEPMEYNINGEIVVSTDLIDPAEIAVSSGQILEHQDDPIADDTNIEHETSSIQHDYLDSNDLSITDEDFMECFDAVPDNEFYDAIDESNDESEMPYNTEVITINEQTEPTTPSQTSATQSFYGWIKDAWNKCTTAVTTTIHEGVDNLRLAIKHLDLHSGNYSFNDHSQSSGETGYVDLAGGESGIMVELTKFVTIMTL